MAWAVVSEVSRKLATGAATLFSYATANDDPASGGYKPAQVFTNEQYDAAGKVVRTQDGNGHYTYQYYDAKGNHILQVDATGAVAQWEYNGQRQVLKETQYAGQLKGDFLASLSAATAVSDILNAIPAPTSTQGANRTTRLGPCAGGGLSLAVEVVEAYAIDTAALTTASDSNG